MEKILLKESVIKFKNGLISRREILSLLNDLIMKSIKHLLKDKDKISDFYLFFISNIEKYLKSYDEQKFNDFERWFCKVLKNSFLNFIKSNQKREKDICFLPYIEMENVEVSEIPKIHLNTSQLTEKEKRIFELKFGLTEDENIKEIILQKMERKREKEDLLSFTYLRLLRIQYNIKTEYDIYKRERLKRIEEMIRSSKRKLEKSLKTFKVFPTDKVVANKVGLSESTVSVLVNRIIKKLRNSNNLKHLLNESY